MVAIGIGVSVSQDEKDFMDEYNLSPSQLLKEKIWEMRGMIGKIVRDKISRLTSTVEMLARENESLKEKYDVVDEEKSKD